MHQPKQRLSPRVGITIILVIIGSCIIIPILTHSFEAFEYVVIFWIFLVGGIIFYDGAKKLDEAQRNEQKIVWHQQTQITQAIGFLFLGLLLSISSGIFSFPDHSIKVIVATILFLFSMVFLVLTLMNVARSIMKNQSGTK